MTRIVASRYESARPATGMDPAERKSLGPGLLVAVGFCVIVLLIRQFDAPVVLLGGAALMSALLLLLWPELATLTTVFLLYTNIPALVTHRLGVPVAIAGLFILLLAVPLLHALIIRRERIRLDLTLCLMLGYLAVVLLSAFVAQDPTITLEYARRFVLEGIVVYFLVVNVVRSRMTLRRVVWTMLAAGSLLGSLTTYQEVTRSFHQEFGGLAARNHEFLALRQLDRTDPEARELLEAYTERYGRGKQRAQRANGPLDEPNRFAQILIVLLPFTIFGYRTGRRPWPRAAATAAGVLIASGLVFSDSRGAFITLVPLALLAVHARWIPRSHLLAGAVAFSLIVPVVAPRLVQRIASITGAASFDEDGSTGATDGAMKGRAAAMSAAARVFLDHPMFGVGAGQFRRFYSARYQEQDPRFVQRQAQDMQAHSLYLEQAAELGVLGLVAFFAIFAQLLGALVRARRQWNASSPELTQLAGAILFSILAHLGTSVFLHLGFQRYLWLLVALASATLHLPRTALPVGAR